MKTIGAGAFKAKCLAVMKDVHGGQGDVVVTMRGEPFVKIVPIAPVKPESIFGFLKGKARVTGDIVSPIVEAWEWDGDIFPPGTPERGEYERSKPNPTRAKARRK
jgi:prevent-host-death family protein